MFKKILEKFGYVNITDWKKDNLVELQTEYFYLDLEIKESQTAAQKKVIIEELKKAVSHQLINQVKIEEVDILTSKELKIRAVISVVK